ncbi:MAG: glutamate--tRNA ligase family protein [Bacteroidota bacterium]
MTTRFAPTPSGYLHQGNAVNLAVTWLWARLEGGSIRLRIDDLDQARVRPEYVEDVFVSLEWLGLDYDIGPMGPEDHERNFSQIHRVEEYQKVLGQLWEEGRLFACDCSRKQIRAAHPAGLYTGRCRERGLDQEKPNTALRLRTDETLIRWEDLAQGKVQLQLSKVMPDFVVRRKDGIPAYQIASLVDDHTYGTTAFIRGADLLESTAAQHVLAHQLGWDLFEQAECLHHPLLTDEKGEKLSKSAGASSLKHMRESGLMPSAIFQKVSSWLDLPQSASSAQELLQICQESAIDIRRIWA